MTNALLKLPNSHWATNLSDDFHGASISFDLRTALRALYEKAEIPGVEDVRILRRESRRTDARDKVFFILKTHDIDRDARVVVLMSQFEAVDYDLVPLESVGMVPDAASSVL